jgi:hypothetical protein
MTKQDAIALSILLLWAVVSFVSARGIYKLFEKWGWTK